MNQVKQFQIGKKGLTSEAIEQIKKTFEKKETRLVKISILKSAVSNKKEAEEIKEKLMETLGAHFTGKLVGHTIILRWWRKARQ